LQDPLQQHSEAWRTALGSLDNYHRNVHNTSASTTANSCSASEANDVSGPDAVPSGAGRGQSFPRQAVDASTSPTRRDHQLLASVKRQLSEPVPRTSSVSVQRTCPKPANTQQMVWSQV
jgi:hypothetical protein